MPLLFFGLLELGLRLAGFGYPTAFLLKSSNHGENTFVQNNQFGWRFFGPRMAREPEAISIPREKPPNTARIFVFGESAAYGDPQPRFGLPRMLEAMLELRHPGKKFEVVNAAMTAINSHVILPLSRDCAKAHADVWVIYMGNNEVVGPFGPGTVFGRQALPRPLIRGVVALKATCIGQLLDSLRGSVADGGEWEGMSMFVKYKIDGLDPRLRIVYENFGRNLEDIIAAGQKSGAKIVVSTVAVNLKDCPPFASLHRPDLSGSQSNDWQRLFDAGAIAQQSGDFRQAAAEYDQAEGIDGNFAELRFRRGQCALALNDAVAAQQEFVAARDLDALRFRCDSPLNGIIRRQANDTVRLADGERALAAASPDQIPGANLFYEHVHLTFQGNYVLARAIAEKVENVLALPAVTGWPELAACEQRLGHTPRDVQLALSIMLGRVSDPPFTFQANHQEQLRRLSDISRGLPPPNSPVALREAQSAAEAALARWPGDAELWEQLGEIKARAGQYDGAIAAVEHSLDLVPSRGPECWLLYGTLLAQEGKYADAIRAFKRVSPFYSRADWAGDNLALCLEKLGRREEAVAEMKRVLALKPDYGMGWLMLGQFYERMSRTNDAEQCYVKALTKRFNGAHDLAALARYCASRRWFERAITNFFAAIELSPSDPVLRMEAGAVLADSGRRNEAIDQYVAASKLAPGQPQPHAQLGFEFGRLGRPDLAENEFREVLRLDPNSTEAVVALGVCLYDQKKFDQAREQFQAALQRSPNDETASRFIKLLGNRTAPQ